MIYFLSVYYCETKPESLNLVWINITLAINYFDNLLSNLAYNPTNSKVYPLY